MKIIDNYRLVLGSKSPRRKELLGWLQIPFVVEVSTIEEISAKIKPQMIAEDIAQKKGQDILQKLIKDNFKQQLVVSADTIVCIDHEILGKPKDITEAKNMLMRLSNREHDVITAVYLGKYNQCMQDGCGKVFSCKTKVHFKKIDQDLLQNYLDSGDSMDKAGAYGIQGQSLTFIDRIEGSYSNVVGFPLDMFIDELKNFLGHPGETAGQWRKKIRSA
ncbi:MAG: septum formation protein Maf [Bdellovibrionales bacterium RIFOXYB1_FULL_37_110]|nr:MAG: septum formation protein Maf [Bdellovibrionales bacterium RIFOXYA1_FULL_38_20]OFZ45489.1 MAG: septum formation protein Maf [Bdellovibrionales bacterium RIFOXYC1_FULL_37_79]OFZ60636.1 MAG: septum formation protein Maf [Bdellovibrionales bacterium RIFOXYB1_FULL_37_110]OFZ63448.1 MAG: septum formation protein Maf [Bdellovibrionales bacterium RIFOXYD1_FULL_36_51]